MSVSEMLYIATIAMRVASALFALAYIIVNFSRDPDAVAERSKPALRMCNVSMYLSLLLPFLACLLVEDSGVYLAIDNAIYMFGTLTVQWGVTFALCLLILFIVLVSRRLYKLEGALALRKMIRVSVKSSVRRNG